MSTATVMALVGGWALHHVMFLSMAVAAYAGPQLGAGIAEASGGDYTAAFVVAAIAGGIGLLLAVAYVALADRKVRVRRSAPGT